MWFDPVIGRLNRDERGEYLGNFGASDNILVIYKDGSYELTNFDLTNNYGSNDVLLVKKFHPKLPITAVYFDGVQKHHFIKRFTIETSTLDKKFLFISDARNTKLILASTDSRPRLQITLPKVAGSEPVIHEYLIEDLIDIRGWKAIGNKLPHDKFKDICWLEPLEEIVPEEIPEEAADNDDQTEDGDQTDESANVTVADDTVESEDKKETGETPPDEHQKQKSKKDTKKGSDGGQSQLGLFE
jgi:topoisomerase-4 subunit A